MTTRAKSTTPPINTRLLPNENSPHTNRSFYQYALREAVLGLNPGCQRDEPAIFTISLVNLVTASIFLGSILTGNYVAAFISGMVTLWLCVTLLWFTFARTITRKQFYTRSEALDQLPAPAVAKRLGRAGHIGETELVPITTLAQEDVILVEQGDIIPADGEVIDGIAAVDEQVLTGSREPAVRLVNNSLNAVSAGTQVCSGQLIIALKSRPGGGLASRISDLARGKKDTHLPSNILLNTLTAGSIGLTMVVALCLLIADTGQSTGLVMLSLVTALLAALIPSPTAGLQTLATTSGTNQLIRLHFLPVRDNVLPRLVQTTVVFLNENDVLIPNSQQAVDFVPAGGGHTAPVSDAGGATHFFDRSSLNDNGLQHSSTGHSSPRPARGLTDIQVTHTLLPLESHPGKPEHLQLYHGSPEAVVSFLRTHGVVGIPPDLTKIMKSVMDRGGQPLVITQSDAITGVLHVQRQFRTELKNRVERLRHLGIQIILVGKDSPPATANLAAAIGADNFLASATDEKIQALVKQLHDAGQQTLLAGSQPRDAIALNLVGTGVALAQSAYPARKAADIIDLDNSPVRILDLLEAGRQWLTTRQALTVLAGTSDLVKFLVMGLLVLGVIFPVPYFEAKTTVSAVAGIVLTGLVFNVVSLVVLTPLALGWLPFPLINSVHSQRNIWVACGVCGLLLPLSGLALVTLLTAGLRGG